ncbi:MAG: hypothetical protein IH597_00780 [Bacteroidales bacterium]|nr:hypothetical protein [Bacteroidales bacterium]
MIIKVEEVVLDNYKLSGVLSGIANAAQRSSTILKNEIMKLLFTILALILFNDSSYPQSTQQESLWGEYIIQKEYFMQLSICEDNYWHFTNFIAMLLKKTHSYHDPDCNFFEVNGKYEIVDSIIFLYDNNDQLFFSLKILDTLNIQVSYAKDGLTNGDFLNRTTAFYPGHYCSGFPENYDLIRWIIFEDRNELWRFGKPGNIFTSKDYEIGKLPNDYWRKNERD